jgi:hypothetical protein
MLKKKKEYRINFQLSHAACGMAAKEHERKAMNGTQKKMRAM